MESQQEMSPPTYALRFSQEAIRAVNALFVYVADNCGKVGDEATDYAIAYRDDLYSHIAKLATLPHRYAVAEEARYMGYPPVRALPFRHHTAGSTWRVLYRIHESNPLDAAFVEIVTIRHGSQKPMTRKEARAIDAANR